MRERANRPDDEYRHHERRDNDEHRYESIADLGVVGRSDQDGADNHGHSLRQTWHRLVTTKVSVLVVVAACAVAAGSAAVITRRQLDQSTRVADESVVSLVVLSGPLQSSAHTFDDTSTVHLQHRLDVVNTGPVVIEVSDLSSTQEGFTFHSLPTLRPIKAGAAEAVFVDLAVDCQRGLPTRPVPVRMTVRTQDGRSRQETRPIFFAASPVSELVGGLCGTADGGVLRFHVPGPYVTNSAVDR